MKKRIFSSIFFLLFSFISIFSVIAQPLDVDKLKEMKARSIGPAGMSGRVVAIDAVISDPDIIYVGTASGGVWKSTSGGTTWDPVFDDQKVINIGAIAITQSNPDVVWVGTGEGNPRNSLNLGAGIYRSPDAGKTWEYMGLENTRNIHRIIIDPRDENTVYVGSIGNPWGEHAERGIYKTIDGGKTWEKILYVDEKTGVADLVMDPSNPNKLIAAMWQHRRKPWFFESGGPGSGLYVTVDGGKTWTKRSSKDGLPAGDLGRIGVAIAPSNPNIVYAIIESEKNALYKSEDGGNKWTMINDRDDIGNRPFYYFEIYVDTKNENRLYTIYSDVGVSNDGGKSFSTILDNIHSDHHAWWIHSEDPNFMIDGNDGGMAISRDRGKTWRYIENMPVGQFYHIRVDNDIPYNIYGGMQDNGSWRGPAYVWIRGGILNGYWQEVMFGDGFDVVPDPDDSRYGYAMSQGGALGRYDVKTGFSYTIRPTAPDLKTKLRFNWNTAIEQDPFDPSTIYYGSQFVHKSTDKGLTWEIISPDLTTNDLEKQKQAESGGLTLDVTGAENHTTILTISVSPLDKNVIWVGTDDGNLQLTRDGGKSWSNVSGKLTGLPKNGWIPQVRASVYNAGELWVVANNYRLGDFTPYAYHTTDFGATWERIVDGQDVFGYALTVLQDPVEPNLVFLGTEHGLYISIDKGKSWVQWKHGYPSVSTMDLAIQEREADLVIGTFGRSVYVLDDIRPLRKIAASGGKVLENKFVLFDPPDAISIAALKSTPGIHFPGDASFSGENKPFGGVLTFYLKAEEKIEEITQPSVKNKQEAKNKEQTNNTGQEEKKIKYDSVYINIYDVENERIRTLVYKAEPGINRVIWGLDKKGVRYPGRSGFSRGMGPRQQEPGGYIAMPGKYKVVMACGDRKDSAWINVSFNPYIDVSITDLKATETIFEELSKRADLVRQAAERLDESKNLTDKIISQTKDIKTDDIKELIKQTRSIQDSIKLINEFIFGKESEKQGISGRAELTVSSKLYEASNYIRSRLAGPTDTERKLLAEVDILVNQTLEKVNNFYQNVWPGYRKKVENTNLIRFKDYEPLEL
ncbi:MAG: hypothetical protein AMS27_06745 [Bacteroides sp. SM23_62_1]|nr:MAG: hypothetical protein AMS27_06745 [Bacteroides sp. SM23_62_1]